MIQRHHPKNFFLPTIFIIVLAVLLTCMSIWQFKRYFEKKSIKDIITTSIARNPTHLDNLNNLTKYKNIKIHGNFLHDKEIYLYSLASGESQYNRSSRKYLLLTPFRTTDNRVIIVVRGWLNAQYKHPKSRVKTVKQYKKPITITGITLPSQSKPYLTSLVDEKYNIWFSIHLPKIGQFINERLEQNFLTLTSQTPATNYDDNVLSQVDPEYFLQAVYKNNHLTYFITWLALDISIILLYVIYYMQQKKLDAETLIAEKRQYS